MHLKPIQLQKPVSDKSPSLQKKNIKTLWFSPQIQYEEIHLSHL